MTAAGRCGSRLARACVLVLSLMACAPVEAPVASVPDDGRNAPARREPTALMRADAESVGDIMTRGFMAQASGDGEELYNAAMALQSVGAHPETGTDDLARQWMKQAADLGVRMPVIYASRGRTLGPGYRQGRVGANGQFRTHQAFNAGQRAEIVLVPMDDAPLSLDVVDDEGSQICSVAPSTRNLGCRWVPSFTGRSDIEVTNENDHPVNFYIVLN